MISRVNEPYTDRRRMSLRSFCPLVLALSSVFQFTDKFQILYNFSLFDLCAFPSIASLHIETAVHFKSSYGLCFDTMLSLNCGSNRCFGAWGVMYITA